MNQAKAEPVISVISLEENNLNNHSHPKGDFQGRITPVTELEKSDLIPESLNPILLAAPENFNPSLKLPPPPPPPPPKITPPPISTEPLKPFAILENIQIDFRNDSDNFGQTNQIIEPTAEFRLENGNLISLKTGFNTFKKSEIETITNIPLQVGWSGKIGDVTLETAAGIDIFNRLPTAINFNAKVEAPISPPKVSPDGKLTSLVAISGNIEQGLYKFNVETLDNQITVWRFGPNLFWQIDQKTSLFALYRWGIYNDGNSEQQSFSRLERKLGKFSVAANLFTWNYTNNVEQQSGYFSPPDFIVYNAELVWEKNLFDGLRCRFTFTVGQQRLNGKFDQANTYGTRCTTKLAPSAELDLGYIFSNVRNQDTGESAYNNNGLSGQLRLKF
ncbi:hypothetical protein VB620_06205 [Nodularia harveyana UHCC-0300]|uniref:Uncharacterized protein n=2 Tax=Nodularia harveyana TaxID=114805 RepID=A0ABU5UBM8_9CYAN|nr:hypothetical protein [Nodularia harveyana UHCC-0300]